MSVPQAAASYVQSTMSYEYEQKSMASCPIKHAFAEAVHQFVMACLFSASTMDGKSLSPQSVSCRDTMLPVQHAWTAVEPENTPHLNHLGDAFKRAGYVPLD